MTISDKRLKELADEMARHMGMATKPKTRPMLVRQGQAVPFQKAGMDAVTRAGIYARIRDLSKMYSLAWLVRQETMRVHGVLECLQDDELSALLEKMERGRECRVEGVGFDEAGLVRSTEM